MKHLTITILFTVIALHVFSQSPPVAVADSANVNFGEHITINVTANDYHPDGLGFKIRSSQYPFTDSTITLHIDYDRYYNLNGEHIFSYMLEDENGLWGVESVGRVYLNIINNYSDTLDANNIKTLINPYGLHFWDGPKTDDNYIYEFPKESGKSTIYNSTFWIGGMDQDDQLRLSAERFRAQGIDFWSGPLSVENNSLSIDTATVVEWHQVWKLNKYDVEYHKYNWNQPNYEPVENIATWPAHGDEALHQSQYLAPFVDVDGDGYYDPYSGDYPLIKGDQCIFFIFNDLRYEQTETQGNPIGLEIHSMMYQFDNPDNPAFNNTVFMNYKIFNRSEYILTDAYIGIWTSIEIGYGNDDYVGCDVERGMYFGYNGDEIDGNGEPHAYGENPPAQGVLFLGGPYMDSNEVDDPDGGCDESINGVGFGDSIIDNERYGMTGFLFHNNTGSPLGDPIVSEDYYNFLRGIWKDGTSMDYGNTGHPDGSSYGPACKFMFPGLTDSCFWGTGGLQPNGLINWSEETGWNGNPNPPADRRGLGSMGPFTFMPGSVQKIDIAYVTARGDDGPLSSVELLKVYVDTIRARYIKNSDDFGTQLLGIGKVNNKTQQLKIFPNPVDDILQVEYKGKTQNTVYSIHDIYGRLLISGDVHSTGRFSINVSNLKNGFYIVSIIDDEHRYTARLIKR